MGAVVSNLRTGTAGAAPNGSGEAAAAIAWCGISMCGRMATRCASTAGINNEGDLRYVVSVEHASPSKETS